MRAGVRAVVAVYLSATASLWLAEVGVAQEPTAPSAELDALRVRLEQSSDELYQAQISYTSAVARNQPEMAALFTEKVFPILEAKCFECHGPDEQEGGLRLDSREAFLRGGETGTIVTLGAPETSRIIRAVQRLNELKMPPKRKLQPEEVEVLVNWVAAGAPWPDNSPPSSNPDGLPKMVARDVPVSTFEVLDGDPVDFNRDIQPLLSDRCYACHGPDAATRQAGLRLDLQDAAVHPLKSGRAAIVPGDLAQSQLFQRITAEHAADRMPPSEFHKKLSDEEIQRIARWLKQGAPWDEHWAFETPIRPDLPKVTDTSWVRGPLDTFVLARMEAESLRPNAPADQRSLIRRVTLDLTGLPPTPSEIRGYLEDSRVDAYELLVDRLLDSPAYGEHMARYWLDAARYADTNGYHIDNMRRMWIWRDWVIEAFNSDKPFDEFTTEQVAGDLLPESTLQQRIATGFNRNHMINFEGGAIPEEYRVQYVMDRVDTTSTVWLGLTMHCAQCHDHKFDPISQRDFYRMTAYFNSVEEQGLDGNQGNAAPVIKVPLDDQAVRLQSLEERRERLATRMENLPEAVEQGFREWRDESESALGRAWQRIVPQSAKSLYGSKVAIEEDGSIRVSGDNPDKEVFELALETLQDEVSAIQLLAYRDASDSELGPGRSENGNFVITEFEVEASALADPENRIPVHFQLALADHDQEGLRIAGAIDGDPTTGWSAEGMRLKENRVALFRLDSPIQIDEGVRLHIRIRQESQYPQRVMRHFAIALSSDPKDAAAKLGPWRISGPYIASRGREPFTVPFKPEKKIDLDAISNDGRPVWNLAEVAALHGDGAVYFHRAIDSPSPRILAATLSTRAALKVWLNEDLLIERPPSESDAIDSTPLEIPLESGRNTLLIKLVDPGDDSEFQFARVAEHRMNLSHQLQAALTIARDQRGESLANPLRTHYLRASSPDWLRYERHQERLNDLLATLELSIPTTMVMAEMEEVRPTFVLDRGQYDQPTEEVNPGVPEFLGLNSDAFVENRLGLARWLTDPDHPLTARVTVNRFWQQLFGQGIVRTPENFGTQGARPTHPQLLDWMAREFVESGWKVKDLVRLIVTSATYRQSSKSTPEDFQRDPENFFYARGSHHRLDAEAIRDGALAVSGLLNRQIGGPSVYPYQPPGLWQEVGYGGGFTAQIFELSSGEDLYRRSMYTFWKRTSPPPSMMIFDAPNRETCSVRRSRSNTPLQALVLMNDPQFVEASRAFAERILREGGTNTPVRIEFAFEAVTSQLPTPLEHAILEEAYQVQRAHFADHPNEAQALIAVGDSKADPQHNPAELAAWTIVANTLLNLDRALTKS